MKRGREILIRMQEKAKIHNGLEDSNHGDHEMPSYHRQKAAKKSHYQRSLPRHILVEETGELARNNLDMIILCKGGWVVGSLLVTVLRIEVLS